MLPLLIALFACVSVFASETLDRQLQRIYSSDDFKIRHFGPARWMENGAAYTTVEDAKGDKGQDIVRYDTASGRRSVLISAKQLKGMKVDDYIWSTDGQRLLLFTNTRKVWRQNTRGDYWVLDRNSGKLHQLGANGPEATLMFAKFSPDGGRVAYLRANNLYVEDLVSAAVTLVTTDGSAVIVNGTGDWVYEEELSLRDGFRWSPDGKRLAYWQSDTSGVPQFALINNTDSLYPVVTNIPYPKAGTTNSAVRVGVVSATGGATQWMALPGEPRQHYVFRMDFTTRDELVIGQLNRLQNRMVLFTANASTGVAKPMVEDKDDAWLDVPAPTVPLHLVADGLVWLSDRDGWRRAWIFPRDGSAPRALTPSGWDVVALESVEADGLYFTAAPQDATSRELYRVGLNGGAATRVTPAAQPGAHTYRIAPGGKWAFHTHARFDRPPVTDLVELPSHRVVRTLEDNAEARRNVAALGEKPVEFFQVDVGEGAMLDAWMLKPKNFDPARKYPVIVHVYGEPAGTTVVNNWGQNNLFHHALAEEGYLVVSFDNRGTPAPKGRAWRKSIYGAVGVLSAADQAAAVKSLANQRPYVDLSRIAIWGWSGGGSNTLNALFRAPDVFHVGVSVAPVPQQKYYDTIYQERYMGLPEQNAEGYKQGSPITHAEGLKGRLLIVHGTGDDNVHFQGTEQLINRLIELGKPFDMMEYPNRSHSISEGKGTSLHVHKLIARYLTEHLPAGGR